MVVILNGGEASGIVLSTASALPTVVRSLGSWRPPQGDIAKMQRSIVILNGGEAGGIVLSTASALPAVVRSLGGLTPSSG
jgi:hypothetical protein